MVREKKSIIIPTISDTNHSLPILKVAILVKYNGRTGYVETWNGERLMIHIETLMHKRKRPVIGESVLISISPIDKISIESVSAYK